MHPSTFFYLKRPASVAKSAWMTIIVQPRYRRPWWVLRQSRAIHPSQRGTLASRSFRRC